MESPVQLALRNKSAGELAKLAWRQIWPERYHSQCANSDAQRRFARDGLLVLPELISPDEVLEANGEFDRALREGKNPGTGEAVYEKPKDVKNIPSILSLSPSFRKLMHHPKLMPYLEATIGCRVKMFHPQALIYPRGAKFFNSWHTDLPNRMPWIDLASSTIFVKAIFYLSDVTRDSGAFTFIRGSHRAGARRSFSYLHDAVLRRHKIDVVEGKAGTVVLFHTSGFHKVQPNILAERRTLTYTYTHFWVRNNFEAPVLKGLNPDEMTATERHMMGFRRDGEATYDQICPDFRENGSQAAPE